MLRALAVLLIVFAAFPASAADLTITTIADVVNGDISSPDALKATPGPDGIALREAIMASNNARGPHSITFSPSLVGQTLTPTVPLPVVTQDFVTITGVADSDGQPGITVSLHGGLRVAGSHFALTGIRFDGAGVHIFQGEDFRIEANIFSRDRTGAGFAIGVATDNGSSQVTIRDVTIVGNTFVHYTDVAIGCGINGLNGTIENVRVTRNTFEDNLYPIEFVLTGTNGRFSEARIEGNRFTNNFQPITLTGSQSLPLPFPDAFNNVMENVLISGNVIASDHNPSILVAGGSNGRRGSILNTVISNNLITGTGSCAICIVGGDMPDGESRVGSVVIVNNTISVAGTADGVSVYANAGRGTANQVTGLAITNTIIQVTGSNFTPEVRPDHVRSSLLHPAKRNGFVGTNGNIEADPRFVNSTQANFHLQSGSPAVDAGATEGAPSTDLECRRRAGRPDIGAFEAGALPAAVLVLKKVGTGSGTFSPTPDGHDCYGGAAYDTGTIVTLTSTPDAGSVFAGWSGAADCTDGVVTMIQNLTCTAMFNTAAIEPQRQ